VTGAAEAIPLVAVLVGAPDLQALLAAKAPFAEFIAARGGAALAQGMSLAVALAIVNAVIATLLLSARQLYASGRDRTWGGPLNRLFTRLHPRLGSPWAATLVVGALVGSLCFLGLKLLLIATGTGAAGIYAILCVAALRGRRTGATRSAVYSMPLFPWIPILTLIALGGVFVSDALDAEEGRPGLAVSLSVAVAFAAYYLVRARQKGGWTPTVVEEAADDGDPITAQEITPLPARSLQPFFSDGREDA
jgi:amino acid transporter